MAKDRAQAHSFDGAPSALLAWFDEHKRDLPWRRTRDPYAIWVSEIMLQQTRVAAVLDHYARWMQHFPTVADLASAEESEVLALWSGLGYYRRARMLHKAAKIVVEQHGGHLPRTAVDLRTLPGIGEYTSAAIASIAFGESVAVVDGNVERIVTRMEGLALPPSEPVGIDGSTAQTKPAGKQAELARRIRAGATALLTPERPGDANQAMMELGATVCLPRGPLCLQCPVQRWCRTRGEHVVAPRKAPVQRAICYALLTRKRSGEPSVLLHQRPADASLMAAMWELPELSEAPADLEVAARLRHAITVTNYAVTVVRCEEKNIAQHPAARWVSVAELPSFALTGLARKTLRKLALWPK